MMKKLLCTLLVAIFAIGFINAQFGDVSGGSPLQVITTTSSPSTANTPIAADGTDMGSVVVGNSISKTFTFTAATNNNLYISTVALSGDFTVNSPSPFLTTSIGDTSSFTVNFTPTSVGTQTAVVHVRATDPVLLIFGVTEDYYFEITAEGLPPVPDIGVVGDDSVVINNGHSTTSGDNTDFGQAVANVETVTRSFTVANNGGEDLDISYLDFIPSPDSHYSIVLPPGVTLPYTLTPGSSFTYEIVFSPVSIASPLSGTVFIFSTDPDTPFFTYQVSGEGVAPYPIMEVTGNGNPIADGSATASDSNHTQFLDTDINAFGGSTRIFTIENTGTDTLRLNNIPIVQISGADAADFTVIANPATIIAPGGTTTFTVEFNPTISGTKVAEISIDNNTPGTDPYNFVIQGEATDVVTTGQLMISQYYEGLGTEDQWIEIKNISNAPSPGGNYYLCLYVDANTNQGTVEFTAPDHSVAIPAIPAGGVLLFKNSLAGGATLPLAANMGSATVIPTLAANFTGNDIILISTSTAASTCYNDRIDILGVSNIGSGSPTPWGENLSIIKGCGNTQLPSRTFDINDFIILDLDEVNNADPDSNVALGTQYSGPAEWTTVWNNGKPDRTRSVTITGTYTAADGSLTACNLTVDGNLDFNSGTSNYVEVTTSLTINGTFTVGDQESLYTVNERDPYGTTVAISGVITKYETTTSLTNASDYTYWSSPVQNASISSVFPSGTYDQGRIFYWDQSATNVDGVGGNQVLGEWIPAAGQTMKVGQGYISQGPVTGSYPGTATVAFTGIPNNGTIKSEATGVNLVFNDDGNSLNDMNLIGNPYPSAIDADKFILEGNNLSTLSGTLYFWSHKTPNNEDTTGEQYTFNDYALYNLTGFVGPGSGTGSPSGAPAPGQYIGSGQGFVVAADNANPKTTFTDAMRVKGDNTQFFRGTETKKSTSEEKNRVWLQANSSIGGANSQILVAFDENATDGYDKGYDGIKLSEGWINLYSKIDTLKYGIQALGNFSIDKEVPLAFQTYIEDADVSYTIGIDQFEGAIKDNDLYLVDHELNVTHDLKQGDYTFEAATGSHDDRFSLVFKKATLGVDDIEMNNDFVIVSEESALLIKSKTIVSELKMYDVTGRLLVNMLPNESEFRVNTHNIRKGTVLILNTTFENGTELSKKAIKY
ncbi:choice-of-anchor D domain-containing protein [Aureibaculum marinum]|uniref:Choice-of-anchor D domain-containing protein n=1 Tax=Aureibaculum marinum TaxID=2487930 RepID=A0A3N4P7L7_9FLAO|nr:choice-of-anchor D domain-containing protein [Aureibaculum marinum]RPE00847.1 choice-of-anchor D domain-containing protein [Aureibaculum marinum]